MPRIARTRLTFALNQIKANVNRLATAVSIPLAAGCYGADLESATAQDEVLWSACGAHECTRYDLPLRFDRDDGLRKHIAVRRTPPNAGSRHQLWLIPGGPGVSGTRSLPATMDQFREQFGGVDVYTLDAFGTGSSEPLRCPAAEAAHGDEGRSIAASEVDACLSRIETAVEAAGLDSYGITAAAHDLAELISRNRSDNKEVILISESAGTLWAQRLLVLYPELVDAVVMDAFVPPGYSARTMTDATEQAMNRVLALCASEGRCHERLPNPHQQTFLLWQRLAEGHCSTLGVSPTNVQRVLVQLLADSRNYDLIPRIIAALKQCSGEDVRWLQSLDIFESMPTFQPSDLAPDFSAVVFQLIMASELWSIDAWSSEEDFEDYIGAASSTGLSGDGAQALQLAHSLARWPRYTDALSDDWPDTPVAMLIFHGGLDPRVDDQHAEMARRYSGPAQWYFRFPYSAHRVLETPSETGGQCAMELLGQFLRDPTARGKLDTRCLAEVRGPTLGW